MARMYGNEECPCRDFGYSFQLTNWILDSIATCHMTPEFTYFIPGLLDDMDKHIEVADIHHVKAKQKVQVRIKMCYNNGDTCISKFHNQILAPDLCDRLFFITKLMIS